MIPVRRIKLFAIRPRRNAEIHLRGEAAKVVLGRMGLRVDRVHVAAALQRFLRDDPELRWSLVHRARSARAQRNALADVAIATFNADGSLGGLEPMLERTNNPLLDGVCSEIVKAFNRSRHEDDIERPARLAYEFATGVEHHAPWPLASHLLAARLAQRVLRATWVSRDDGGDRFTAPDFHRRKGSGFAALNVVVQAAADGTTDLWLQAHPAAFDLHSAQATLNRFASLLGKVALAFPMQGGSPVRVAGEAHGRRIERTQDWIDFTPLIRSQRELDAKLDTAITGRPLLSALLVWQLARQPEFAGRTFSIAEHQAAAKAGEAATYFPIRPADYFEGPTGPRIAAYVREFNRLQAAVHRRHGADFRALVKRGRASATFGVAILRDADAFLAPMPDVGFTDGFLAIGNMMLPTPEGIAGSASFAAPAGVAARYPAALGRAILAEI